MVQVILLLFWFLSILMLSKSECKNKNVNELKAKLVNVIGNKCWLPLEYLHLHILAPGKHLMPDVTSKSWEMGT